MRGVFVLAVCSLLLSAKLWAVPAAPIEVQLEQPDTGERFWAKAAGSEYADWMETLDGFSVVKDTGGVWSYAAKDAAGQLIPTGVRPSKGTIAPAGVAPHLSPAANQEMLAQPRVLRRIPQSKSLIRTQNVLVVLVNFSDISFTYSDASFQSLIFGGADSVKEFYLENTYNNFTLTPAAESYGTANDGIVHVTMAAAHPNVGSGDLRPYVSSYLTATDGYVNYASFDSNGNGSISSDELSIVLILAGYENAYGGASSLTPRVWGHMWSMSSALTLDGKNLQPYTAFGERHGTSGGTHQATIGIMCHELGHLMLGLPDLYDINSSNGDSEGIGSWGLMGSGSWNTVSVLGDSPAHLDAWCKSTLDITTPVEIVAATNDFSLLAASGNASIAKVWVDPYKSSRGEYFLLENRQLSGYDAGLPGSGLLIFHVDGALSSNGDETHKWVDLEEADGLAHLDSNTNRGDGGDPFPGTSGNVLFNGTSNPNSDNYSGQDTGVAVSGIPASSSSMAVDIVPLTNLGDNITYATDVASSYGYGNVTAWTAVRFTNSSLEDRIEGFEVYLTGSATVDFHLYSTLSGTTPTTLLHSQTGFAGAGGWNRFLLTTPQSFPVSSDRVLVLKIVNASGLYPVVTESSGSNTGRCYIDFDGIGAFSSAVGRDFCQTLLVRSAEISPVAQLNSAAYSVSENAGNATITVDLDVAPASSCSVQYATSNGSASAGSDYTSASGTLNFTSSDTSKTFSVPISDDGLVEADETVMITLSNPTNCTVSTTNNPATLTIQNNDSAPAVQSVAVASGNSVDVTFSKAMGVGVITAANYTLSGTGKGSLASTPTSVTNTAGNTYRLTWSSGEMVNGGNITVTVASVQDAAGNAIGTPNSGTHTSGGIGTAPTVQSVAVASGTTVDVTFSEAMGTGKTIASNYTVSGAGKGSLATNPSSVANTSGNTYRLTWSSGEMVNGGNITITVASVQDAAGNAIGTPNSGTHTSGGIGTAPTVQTVAVASGTTVDVTFSEAMGTGKTTASNYTVSGAGKGSLATNPSSVANTSGNTYRLTWSSGEMVNGGNITITVASVQDTAGNAIGTPNSGTHTSGGIGTAPTVQSVAVASGTTVDVTFSEAMGTGVTTASNYTVSGTGKGSLATNPNSVANTSGNTYRLTWSSGEMVNGGNITISVASVQDTAGNAIGTPNSGTHTGGGIGTAPSVSIGAPSASMAATGPVSFGITYSGADTVNLVVADVHLQATGDASGNLSVSNGTTNTPTVTVSNISGDGSLAITIDAGTASDTAGNEAAAAGPSTAFTVDNTAPDVTVDSLLAATGTPSLSGTATDPSGISAIVLEVDGTTYAPEINANVWSLDVRNALQVGTYDIAVSATDNAGNSAADATTDELEVSATAAEGLCWAVRMGGTGTDYGQSVATDADGYVYVTGFFQGTVDFDPGVGTLNLTSAGGADIFIQKLDADGNLIWAKKQGGASTDFGYDLAVNASGEVYVTGYFQSTADFDPGAGTSNLVAAGNHDAFVTKLDSSGALLWARRIGGTSLDEGRSIAVDTAGNAYVTGYFQGTADLDPGAATQNATSAGSDDIFVAKLDGSGTLSWAYALGGTGTDRGVAVAVDGDANMFVTGAYWATVDFNPGTGTANLTSMGNMDAFMLELDTNGAFLQAIPAVSGTAYNVGRGIALDSSGNIYLTGGYQGAAPDFDPGAGTLIIPSGGNDDVFVQKLDPTGTLLWVKVFTGSGSVTPDIGFGIALSSTGEIYTAGRFGVTLDVDPSADAASIASQGAADVLLHKLDASGNLVWAHGIGASSDDFGYDIALGLDGGIYATGFFAGTPDFEPGPGTTLLSSSGAEDAFVLKLCPPDVTPPAATSISPATAGPTNADSVDFEVEFSEDVANFDTGDDLIVGHGGSTANSGVSISGGPVIYTVSLTGITGDGEIALSVSTSSNVEDLAGNALDASVTSSAVVIDNTPPLVTRLGSSPLIVEYGSSYSDAGATALDSRDGDLTANIVTVNPVNTAILGDYTVTYDVSDQAGNAATQVTRLVHVVDTTPPVITRLGSSPVNVELGGSYTDDGATALDGRDGDLTANIVTVNPVNTAVLGDYTVTYDVADQAGNAAAQVARLVHVVDTTPPGATISSPAAAVTSQSPIPFDVDFTENVTDFVQGSLGVVNGAISAFSGSGTHYDVEVTPAGQGTVTLSLSAGSVHDSAGNGNTAASPLSRTFDSVAPGVQSIVRSDANPTTASSVQYTVTFTESVSGVDTGDFGLSVTGLSGSQVIGVSGTGSQRNVTVSTGSGSGTLRLNLSDNDTIVDAAGLPVGGAGAGNGNLNGETYTVGPLVLSVTVDSLSTDDSTPQLSGSFSSSYGLTSISVTVNGSVYPASIGASTWTAQVGTPLPAGTYNVLAMATDQFSNQASDSTTNELSIVAGAVYVDFAWAGTESGGLAEPFNTLGEAVAAVGTSGIVRIKGDTADHESSETMTITKGMRLEALNGSVRIGVGAQARNADQSIAPPKTPLGTELAVQEPDTGASSGWLEEAPEHLANTESLYAPLLPVSSPVETGAVLALRLRAESAIDVETLRVRVADGLAATSMATVCHASPGDDTDLWILLTPLGEWPAAGRVLWSVSAYTVDGMQIEPVEHEFLVAGDAFQDDSGEEIFQPRQGRDVVDSGTPEALADQDEVTVVVPIALTSGEHAGTAYRLIPETVFGKPQRVWLPVENPDEAVVEVLVAVGGSGEWHDAREVEDFILSGSQCSVDIEGRNYLGLLVRHGGVVRVLEP